MSQIHITKKLFIQKPNIPCGACNPLCQGGEEVPQALEISASGDR
ncbi:hypothetical protein QUA30_08175 [Microcoleus sp. Pol14C2]